MSEMKESPTSREESPTSEGESPTSEGDSPTSEGESGNGESGDQCYRQKKALTKAQEATDECQKQMAEYQNQLTECRKENESCLAVKSHVDKLKEDKDDVERRFKKAQKEANTVKAEYRRLYAHYEQERLVSREAEKAFYKMKAMYAERKKECDSMESVINGHRRALKKVEEMEEILCEQKLITEEKTKEVELSKHKMDLMENILIQEKHKISKLQRELQIASTPKLVDHSVCDSLMDKVKADKETVQKQMNALCEELEQLKEENEHLNETNKHNKEKMRKIIAIKNELVHQNKTLLQQMKGIQDILLDKDGQIKRLANRRILADPTVRDRIRKINMRHAKNREYWRRQLKAKTRKIRNLAKEAGKFQTRVERTLSTFEKETVPKRKFDILKEKFDRAEDKQKAAVTNMAQGTKRLKQELVETRRAREKEVKALKRDVKTKDVEIKVLVEAKRRYEELLREGKCDVECHMRKRAKTGKRASMKRNRSVEKNVRVKKSGRKAEKSKKRAKKYESLTSLSSFLEDESYFEDEQYASES